PLKKGLYHIYQVDEIKYTLGEAETLAYELKTVVADSFLNNQGNYTYVIHRFKKIDGQSSWQSLDTWSVRKSDKEVVVNEGNIPILALKLPLKTGNQWDGNLYNDQFYEDGSGAEIYEDIFMV